MKSKYALSDEPIKKERKMKHGMSKTKFYYIWLSMRDRCQKPNFLSYPMYGARGIKCLWGSFDEFKHDMYDSYLFHKEKNRENNTQIDRIDNNGHYCKENCKWSTRMEQMKNVRRNVFLTFNGETLHMSEWARRLKMRPSNLHYFIRTGRGLDYLFSKS